MMIMSVCYSAGIGRTGVFIGAEIGMQQLDEKGEVDILKIVSTLRQDRGGMVQTKDQYLFLYQVSMVQIDKVKSVAKSVLKSSLLIFVSISPSLSVHRFWWNIQTIWMKFGVHIKYHQLQHMSTVLPGNQLGWPHHQC